ncbi:hypothetical protein P3S67_032252 [Capsicum chacoense]
MENEGERKNNFVVSFSAVCKDVVNVLDFMERLKNEEDQNAVDIADQIEELKSVLAFICTYIQISYSDLEEFEDIMSAARQWVENLLRPILDDVDSNVGCKYTMDHVLPSLMDNINDCISLCHHSTSSTMMTDEQLNFLLQNLHHRCKYRPEQIFPLETQDEILQNVSVNMKNFHGLIVNGCIEHGIVQYVLPQFQLMAERVGIFLWHVRLDRGYFQKGYWFPKLDFLTELDFLRVEFESSNTNDSGPSVTTNWSWDFHFPSNLNTLSLFDFPLTFDSLSTIARLPNLKELYLRRTLIQEEEWNMGEEDTFENLKYLDLKGMTLAKWEFEVESFPVLEKLVLQGCHKLDDIP